MAEVGAERVDGAPSVPARWLLRLGTLGWLGWLVTSMITTDHYSMIYPTTKK